MLPKDQKDDEALLYPRQIRPADYAPPPKPKQKPSVGLFELLSKDASNVDQQKSSIGGAFAAFQAVQQSPTSRTDRPSTSATDFLAHWQKVTIATQAQKTPLTKRVNAALRGVNMDGLKKATLAKTWKVRTFWYVLIFLLFGVMIYELVQCTMAYLNSPVTTKFTLDTPNEIDFPLVYICYSSSLNRSYMRQHSDLNQIATILRTRSAITKRRKREIEEKGPFILRKARPSGSLGSFADDNRLMDNSDEEDWWNFPSFDDDEDEDGESLRAKRDAVANNSKALTPQEKAKAAADEELTKRVEALMNATNISDVVYQYYYDASYNVEQTFYECEFRGYTRLKFNCSDIITPIIDANYGMCYTVDLPDDLKQTVPGEGLRILMNSHVDLYPQSVLEGPPRMAGLFISVSQQYDPFNWLKTVATAGRLTKIDLEESYIELLDLESGPMIQRCISDDEAQTKLQIFKANYSRTLCQMDCIYKAQRDLCHCIVVIDKSQLKDGILNETSFCNPHQMKGCIGAKETATRVYKMSKECSDSCFAPCKSYRYELRSSSAKLYEPYFSYLSLTPNVTKQLIELRVAHSRIAITKLVQESSQSVSDMIANFGGQINLWLGASLISLIQLMFMALGFTSWRIYGCGQSVLKKKKKKNDV